MAGRPRAPLDLAAGCLAVLVHEWELALVAVVALLVATVFAPRDMWLAVIVCGAVAGGLAIGRLSR